MIVRRRARGPSRSRLRMDKERKGKMGVWRKRGGQDAQRFSTLVGIRRAGRV